MLTNRNESQTSEPAISRLEKLTIDAELKCILYECLQAEQKTNKMDEERYQQEIATHIERESRRTQQGDQ